MNKKYEITDIAHPEYPWLHRIRALQAIPPDIEPGDLGGYVQSESNLATEEGDHAWLYDDAISCNGACVCQDSVLRDNAIAKDQAYVSQGACMCGRSVVEDEAMLQGGQLYDTARISGTGMVLTHKERFVPIIQSEAVIYGHVCGNITLDGKTVILEDARLFHNHKERIHFYDGIARANHSRETLLQPGLSREALRQQKHKERSHDMCR